MNTYFLFTTLLAVFSEAFFISIGIDFKLFYILIFVNISLYIFRNQFKLSKSINYYTVIFFILGFITIIQGNNTLIKLLSQIVGIYIVSTYFFNFFRNSTTSIKSVFKYYAFISFLLSVFGILKAILLTFLNQEIEPVKSILLEPAHFATIVLPACFYFFKSNEIKNSKVYFILIFTAILLSFSSLGYIGLIFGLILIPDSLNIKKSVLTVFFSFLIFYIFYNNVEQFKIRTNDTLASIGDNNLKGSNLSTYALLSNFYVAVNSFTDHPLIGSGLGSHVLSHQKYIGNIDGVETFSDEYVNLNAQDANSLFLRVLSELGLFGLLLTFIFIFKNYSKDIISKAILIYFFCKLFREGHYFSPELYFFVFIYYLNNIYSKKKSLNFESNT